MTHQQRAGGGQAVQVALKVVVGQLQLVQHLGQLAAVVQQPLYSSRTRAAVQRHTRDEGRARVRVHVQGTGREGVKGASRRPGPRVRGVEWVRHAEREGAIPVWVSRL